MFIYASSLCRYSYLKVFEFVIVLLRHIFGVCALAFRRRIVVVEITSVSGVFDFWDDRAFDLSMIQGIPVNGLEEWVRLHKGSAVDTTAGNVAEPLRWIDGTETADEIARLG